MASKPCTQCGIEKPETEFRMQFARMEPRRAAECIECNRARQREIYHRRQRAKTLPAMPSREEEHARELNRTASSWRGPVNRTPLRWAA